jgi:monoamine oxidase
MSQPEVDYCVVGAGFAGLTAAVRLQQAGHTVALLEARDRVGGRTWTVTRDDGTFIDRGGAWVGPGQDAIFGLMKEYGVATYKQYVAGDNVMIVDGKAHRHKGTVPLNLNPWVTANLGGTMLRIGQMTKKIPLEAPWEAPTADELDAHSVGSWLNQRARVPSRAARELLETAMAYGLYTSHPSEVSMLYVLYQMASAGGPQFVLGVEGGAEDARPVGGMGAIYEPMRAELGDAVHLEHPVRRIVQDADGVTVIADGMQVRARRVIVAVPISIAGQIDYEPMLPPERALLLQRMPMGAVFKIAVIYDEPFWRAEGLSGESVSAGWPLPLTPDVCTP